MQKLGVIVTSGRPLQQQLPDGAKFWTKPWVPLDVIREAERMLDVHAALNEWSMSGRWSAWSNHHETIRRRLDAMRWASPVRQYA